MAPASPGPIEDCGAPSDVLHLGSPARRSRSIAMACSIRKCVAQQRAARVGRLERRSPIGRRRRYPPGCPSARGGNRDPGPGRSPPSHARAAEPFLGPSRDAGPCWGEAFVPAALRCSGWEGGGSALVCHRLLRPCASRSLDRRVRRRLQLLAGARNDVSKGEYFLFNRGGMRSHTSEPAPHFSDMSPHAKFHHGHVPAPGLSGPDLPETLGARGEPDPTGFRWEIDRGVAWGRPAFRCEHMIGRIVEGWTRKGWGVRVPSTAVRNTTVRGATIPPLHRA